MDKIFEKLYQEYLDECRGASYLFTNDRYGFERYLKDRMFRLCHLYHEEKSNETK